MAVRINMEYERSVVFRLGKFSRQTGPGLFFTIPIIESLRRVDIRLKTVDVPKQEVITKDNIPMQVNTVVYFKASNPKDAIIKIEDYQYAVRQYTQAALKDVIGNAEMDFVLTERDKVAENIKKIVDKETAEWGIDIEAIKIQEVELPTDMKRAMARQAEAERERRATIIMSEGELAASQNLANAAKKLSSSKGALHLRTLQTISDVSADQSNTIVFVAPIEILEAMKGLGIEVNKK
jgi:regulator of protease activity HflC (stomatin/prohibitin superfamily)